MAGSKQFTVFTKFAVKNNFTGPVLGMAKGADKFAARADQAGKMAQKFGRGAMAAGKFAFGVGVAAAAAGAAVYKLATNSSEAADDILNTAAALGISTKALQEYRYVGIAAGMTTEDMDTALKKLTINLGKDSADVENALYQIGLTADQLKAAGPDKTLELIANGFKGVQDPTKKAAVATALFGKSSVRMVNALSGGEDAIAGLRKEAEDIGYVMGGDTLENAGKLDDTLDKLGATMTGVGNRMAAKMIPGVTKLAASLQKGLAPGGKFANIIDSLGSLGGGIGEGLGPMFDKVLEFVPKLIGYINGLWNAIQPVLKPILGLVEPIFSIFDKLMPVITSVVSAVSTILGPIVDTIKWVLESVDKIIGDTSGSGARGMGGTATVPSAPGSGAPRFQAPMSPAVSTINSNSTSTSKVDITVGNLPAGSKVTQSAPAPGVTLAVGQTRDFATPRGKR